MLCAGAVGSADGAPQRPGVGSGARAPPRFICKRVFLAEAPGLNILKGIRVSSIS